MLARVVALFSGLLVAGSVVPAAQAAQTADGRSGLAPSATAPAPAGLNVPAATGVALSVARATSLALPDGCASVATGTSARVAVVALYAVAGKTGSTIRLGSAAWKLRAKETFSTVAWLPLSSGAFRACAKLADLRSESLKLLAYSTVPSTSLPGGLIDVSARIPLATSGSKAGRWTVPQDAVPASVAGLILQVSAARAGAVQVKSGTATVPIAVGPDVPAATVIVPQGRLSWTSSGRSVRPSALLLGYVTNGDDSVTGGSRLNLLAKPATVTGSVLRLGGKHGLPAITARIPATSVLGSISGAHSEVEDSLAAGRRTPAGSVQGPGRYLAVPAVRRRRGPASAARSR